MKKIIFCLMFVLLTVPLLVFADEKVKVYVFEAGGCPYCEQEISYLKSLDSYGEKFEIIEKELYVDHVDWEKGKDYELGVAVADAFYKHNFQEADSNGTPFVVISDLYASTAYSDDLESYIDKAYKDGDNDAVSCIENGGSSDDCISVTIQLDKTDSDKNNNVESSNVSVLAWLISGCTFLLCVLYIVKSSVDKNSIMKSINNNKK